MGQFVLEHLSEDEGFDLCVRGPREVGHARREVTKRLGEEVSRYRGILDADALLRFTSAAAAAWFDNVPSEFVAKLKKDPEFAHHARGDRDLSQSSGRCRAGPDRTDREQEIEPIDHPGRDLFDLLDEDCITELFPDYPGHVKAKEEWECEVEQRGEALREEWLRTRFGITVDPDPCEVVVRMRASGRIPGEIRSVIDACERLALGVS
jgi:hypothetical protein